MATRVELREALLEAEPLLAEGAILPLPLSRPGVEPGGFPGEPHATPQIGRSTFSFNQLPIRNLMAIWYLNDGKRHLVPTLVPIKIPSRPEPGGVLLVAGGVLLHHMPKD